MFKIVNTLVFNRVDSTEVVCDGAASSEVLKEENDATFEA